MVYTHTLLSAALLFCLAYNCQTAHVFSCLDGHISSPLGRHNGLRDRHIPPRPAVPERGGHEQNNVQWVSKVCQEAMSSIYRQVDDVCTIRHVAVLWMCGIVCALFVSVRFGLIELLTSC